MFGVRRFGEDAPMFGNDTAQTYTVEETAKSSVTEVHRRILGTKTKISITVGIVTVIIVVLTLALLNQQMLTNEKNALYEKGDALLHKNNYTGAVTYFDKALAIDPNFKDALNGKVIPKKLEPFLPLY